MPEPAIYEVRAIGVKLPAPGGLRQNADLSRRINVILAVQSLREKFSAFPVGQITFTKSPVPSLKRGGSRSSRNARRDAVDAAAPLTNGAKADGEVVWS